jgi:hypothetical protein
MFNVRHWHGGQLVIALLLLVVAAVASVIGGLVANASVQDKYSQRSAVITEYRDKQLTALLDSTWQDIRAEYENSPPRGYTIPPVVSRIAARYTTDSTRIASMADSIDMALRDGRNDQQRTILITSGGLIPLALIVTGFVWSWQWFGYRSPRRAIE